MEPTSPSGLLRFLFDHTQCSYFLGQGLLFLLTLLNCFLSRATTVCEAIMGTPWDQMPDYLEAVRRERRPGDPTRYGASGAPSPSSPKILFTDISKNILANATVLLISRVS